MKTRSGRGKKSLTPPTPVRRSLNKNRRKKEAARRRKLSRSFVRPVSETIVLSDSEVDENQPNNDGEEEDIQVIDIAEVTQPNEEVAAPHVPNAEKCIGDYVTAQPGRSPRPVVLGRASGNTAPEPPVIVLGDDPEPDDDGVEVVAVVVSRNNSRGRSLSRRKSTSLTQMQDAIKKAKSTILRQSSSRNASPARYVLNGIAAASRQIQRGNKGKKKQRNFQRNFQWRQQYHQGVNAFHRNRTMEQQRRVVYRIDRNPNGPPGVEAGGSGNVPNTDNRNGNFSFEAIPFIPFATSTPATRVRGVNRGGKHAFGGYVPKKQYNVPPPIAPGSNIMNVGGSEQRPVGTLRPIVIDGSNVAFGHGKMLRMTSFSPKGIKICVDYFLKRGHKEIVVFVPAYRKKATESLDPELLEEMGQNGYVRFTPSREAGGQRIASHDDFFVVEYAHHSGGIIVSNDNFRDLYDRNEHWRSTIQLRLLQYTWITQDCIMFPEDPLGRNGPSLDSFLKF